MKKINKTTTLEKILEIPRSEKILEKYKVPCLACPFAKLEMGDLNLEVICRNYNIDIKKLIKELNNLLKD